MGRRLPGLALALVAAGAACVDTLDLSSDGLRLPPPRAPIIGGVPFDTGSGRDGALLVSGAMTVNTCLTLVSGSASSLTVNGSTAPFDEGRRILVLQVQDTFATSGDSSPVTVPGGAGDWEIAEVDSATGPNVALALPLRHRYVTDPTAAAQVCTIPEFTTVTVGAGDVIRARPWNGTDGGVVALFAHQLDLAGTITATTAGFPGGPRSGNNGGCGSVLPLETSTTEGGGKGRGLDRKAGAPGYTNGRGNLANGGGGGNCLNAGGGGGGNGGAGGSGGFNAMNDPLTSGLPGSRVDLPILERLTFGGGGGGGQCNQSVCTDGQAGGAIVFVVAGRISGAGRIEASGGNALAAGISVDNYTDGAGGGGAGGTLLVVASSATFSGTIAAVGGRGGDVAAATAGTEDHGPGGGGGGGRVHLRGLAPAVIDVFGGSNGVNLPPTTNPASGSSAGQSGVVVVEP